MTRAALRQVRDSDRTAAPASDGARCFAVTRLTLTGFRNYPRLVLDCDARPAVLAGPNGAGKTNLLEALSLLVPGRGLRRARSHEMARRDGDGRWAVAARLQTPDGPVDLGTGIETPAADDDDGGNDSGGGNRRTVRIDGQPARGQAALGQILAMTWLTPSMDGLFSGPAGDRRRFLDRLIAGFDPGHAGRVAACATALAQRLRLLRDGTVDRAWLTALEATIAGKGVAIAAARREFAARLDEAAGAGNGPFPRAGVAVAGPVEAWLAEGPALAAEDRLRETLEAGREADGRAGRTGTGPGASDLLVRFLPAGLPAAEASTGEQKALLLSLVLATARLQALARGAAPVLLLDEVVAHLDADRRQALFDEITGLGGQAWLTGTEHEAFAGLRGRARFLAVRDGVVEARGET